MTNPNSNFNWTTRSGVIIGDLTGSNNNFTNVKAGEIRVFRNEANPSVLIDQSNVGSRMVGYQPATNAANYKLKANIDQAWWITNFPAITGSSKWNYVSMTKFYKTI